MFNEADISRCDFSGSDMQQAQLTGAICSGSIFSKANLSYVDFSQAQLDGALIENAELYRANLHLVMDEGAIWSGSNKSAALGTDEEKAKAQLFKP